MEFRENLISAGKTERFGQGSDEQLNQKVEGPGSERSGFSPLSFREDGIVGRPSLPPSRMIPSVKSKTVPPPPEPTYDLAKVVQEPASILKLYRSRFSRPLFFGFLLNLGSLSFNIMLPYEIGQFISIIDTPEYSSKINHIAQLILTLAVVSAICEWLSKVLFHTYGKCLAKMVRFDIYVSYFKKIRVSMLKDKELEVDEMKCKKAFDFKGVDQNIQVFQENFTDIVPARMRSLIMVLVCFGFLVYTSWQLSIVVLGSALFLGVISALTACCFVTRERKSDELKDVLLDIVRKAFKMRSQLEYNTSGNKFDDANEDIYKHDKSNSCCLGFLRLINILFIFAWKIGIVYYCKVLYLEGLTDSGSSSSSFKDASLPLDQIIVFFLYFIELMRNAAELRSAGFQQHKASLMQAQAELFAKIKLHPTMKESQPADMKIQVIDGKQLDRLNFKVQKDSMLSSNQSMAQPFEPEPRNRVEFEDAFGREAHSSQRQVVIPNLKPEQKRFAEFLGSSIFVDKHNTRAALPYLAEGRAIAIWKLVKQFIGQDLTQVSMPVLLNEPLSAIQKMCELLGSAEHLFREAAVTEDPVRRMVLAYIGQICPFQTLKLRKKKPFNPMLGETFEMVTEHFRFLGEKVYHRPKQVIAFCLEGENYKLLSHNQPNPKFNFNGGRGMLTMNQAGCRDMYFKKYDEHMSFMNPQIVMKNIVWGGLYSDLAGSLTAINHKTGERIQLELIQKVSETEDSKVRGKAYDASGRHVMDIGGSWLDEITITTLATGVTETVWQEPKMVENAHMQYFLSPFSIALNQVNQKMTGVVAPTDSRFRRDQRLFEEGEVDEAEADKLEIEKQQRRVRKKVEDGEIEAWQPRFFKARTHPFVTKELMDVGFEDADGNYSVTQWELREDDQGYWERRKRSDWQDMPNLWGPFEEE